jgi:hypothetical protein
VLPHVQIFMNGGPNPLTSDAQLLSYWFSQNLEVFQDYLVNWINNLRGSHCFGSSRTRRITVGKITKFLTVAYDGVYSPNVSVRMAYVSFGALPCKKNPWWKLCLHVVEIACIAWHASFQSL